MRVEKTAFSTRMNLKGRLVSIHGLLLADHGQCRLATGDQAGPSGQLQCIADRYLKAVPRRGCKSLAASIRSDNHQGML
jgi:hypothetical protein